MAQDGLPGPSEKFRDCERSCGWNGTRVTCSRELELTPAVSATSRENDHGRAWQPILYYVPTDEPCFAHEFVPHNTRAARCHTPQRPATWRARSVWAGVE